MAGGHDVSESYHTHRILRV